MKCKDCKTVLVPGRKQCPNPKCKAWNVVEHATTLEDSTVLLTDAKLATVERIQTGLVDLVFGGGIARTSVNLLSGEPGAGKTTLCLMLCSVFSGIFNHESLYIANEQAAEELRATGERLELPYASKIRIVRAMGGVTYPIGDILNRYKPCITILDSLTKWAGEDPQLAVVLAQQLKEIAVVLNSPVIAIGQVNKNEEHAGLMALQHAVDMTAKFEILEGEHDEEGNLLTANQSPRRLQSTKNRFGPAPEEQFFLMTEKGLESITLAPIGD